MASEVYVYGMTVLSTIHRLKGPFPAPNSYQEIEQTFSMPGGEGANCALVLRNLGVSVELDGCCLGERTEDPLLQYLSERDIACSRLKREEEFAGWQDIVFCDGTDRTVFGWFVQNLFGSQKHWTPPSGEAIGAAQCVALDPFFGDESLSTAELCRQRGTPYVTIDCGWDSAIAQHARAVIVSQEFIDRQYPGVDCAQLFQRYAQTCPGLKIFTFGGREILFAAAGSSQIQTFKPFSVPVIDTLGAGDTFRAGVVYGVLKGMPDSESVRFAAACAAVVCTRFPSVHEPPTLAEVQALMNSAE